MGISAPLSCVTADECRRGQRLKAAFRAKVPRREGKASLGTPSCYPV